MDRKMNYLWNNFSSPTFDVNIGVSQGSVLSPILLALYFSLFLYILEKHLKFFNILVSIISFIDDGLFISQSKLFYISNSCLFCSYNVIIKLLEKFDLIVEHSKTEVFHFNRSHSVFNPSPLNLIPIGGTILQLIDRKLLFHQHVNFYSNKAISMVKCIKILSNSNWDINLSQSIFYINCVSSPLRYIDSNFGFTIALFCCTTWKYWRKCKEEPPYRS